MARITTIGEKSIPIPDMGIICRMRYNTGSVTLYRKCTIGLYGSGFTQDNNDRMIMIHI